MNNISRLVSLFFIGVWIASATTIGADSMPDTAAMSSPRWEMPAYAPRDVLPKLAAAPALDGNLAEWNVAAVTPMRFASYIAHRESKHEWKGPADCGMDAFYAWHDIGVCIAGIVTDDDVRNSRQGDDLYEQDCVELFVDGRTGDAFMQPPYGPGSYHILIRPPVDAAGVVATVRSDLGVIKSLRIAGMRTATGWTFELVIPWSAFPGFEPQAGRPIGIQCGLDDYDARDMDLPQPLMMTGRGVSRLSRSPDKLTRWTLLDAGTENSDPRRDATLALDTPDPICDQKPYLPNHTFPSPDQRAVIAPEITTTIELIRPATFSATSAVCRVRDWTGAVVSQQTIGLDRLPNPDRKAWGGQCRWEVNDAPDGAYRIDVSLNDPQGKTVARTERSVLVLSGLLANGNRIIADAIARLEKADIPHMAQTDPLRAAAWMGAAACVEKP